MACETFALPNNCRWFAACISSRSQTARSGPHKVTTAETKRANLRAIQETVKWFAPGGDWRGLHVFATRESAMNHNAVAQHPSDAAGAERAWKARMRDKYIANGNPYVTTDRMHSNAGGWWNSFGLYQMMAPYHVQRWSWQSPPSILFHPVIATVIAARLWNRGVQLGARNLCDLRSFWKYGRLGNDPDYDKRCASLRERLGRMGYPQSLATKPLASFGLASFGRAPTSGQAEMARDVSDVLGLPSSGMPEPEWTPSNPTTPADPPPDGSDTSPVLASAGAILLTAGAVWAAARYYRS